MVYKSSTSNTGGGGTVTTTGSPVSGNLAKFSGASSITNGDLSGDVVTTGTLVTTIKTNYKINGIGAAFDGGGTAINNGSTFYLACPYAGAITAYTILADTGTCTIATWKIAAGTVIPTVANSISTAGVSLSSGTALHSTNVSDFNTTTVAANDIFGFNITAISAATKITFILEITRT